jgi:outer membrane biosynthesis protein TonB
MLALVIVGGVVSFMMSDSKPRKVAAKKQEIISITLPPPPPPPPVTPPPPKNEPPPPKEEEMIAQEPVPDDEPPPDDSPPESPPSEDLSTGIVGNGPSMGLSGGGGNGTIGGTGRRGGGSKFGWYAAKVQSTITAALRRHPSTRSATMNLQVRIWPDANGRITRAQLVGTSGNAAVDEAIRSNILTGLILPQPPPADMPTPIVLRINARKPS